MLLRLGTSGPGFCSPTEKLVAKFKLQLNAKKTKISRLPQPVTEDWILELGQHTPKGDDPEVRMFFGSWMLRFALPTRTLIVAFLKYAASIVNGLKIGYPKNEACLNYLLGLAFHHSDLLPKLRGLIDSLLVEVFGHVMDFGGACPKIEAVLNECIELVALMACAGRSICWAELDMNCPMR